MHSDFLVLSRLGKKCSENITSEMTRIELLWYNVRDFLHHYVCLKMITNKRVNWNDNKLCDTADTYSKEEYDRKSIPPTNTQKLESELVDIFGNHV
jgi:hypothetical protein